MTIPIELQKIKQWTYSYSKENLKRPKHTHYTPNGGMAFSQAIVMARKNQLSFGFYTTIKDPYVVGDIDHIDDPENPASLHNYALTDLLMNKKVYSEVSPSGKGIRFVAKLPSIEDKEKLRGGVFYTRYPLVDKKEAQINLGTPWLRFTGNETSYSSGAIPTLTIEELGEAFTMKIADDRSEFQNSVPNAEYTLPTDDKLPTLQEMLLVLQSIPLDQNPRIMRAYQGVFEEAYSHYNFWLRILMGVNDYAMKTGTKMECLQAIIVWSRTDDDSYTSDDDVIDKWTSFSKQQEVEIVSYHTVFAIANKNTLRWPRAKPPTKAQQAQGIVDAQPLNTEYVNFKALVDYYNLTLYYDSYAPTKLYIEGDMDIMAQYFEAQRTSYYYEKFRGIYSEKGLVSATHIMAQDTGFIGLNHQQTTQHIRNWMFQMKNSIDLVKRYFDTPYDELPESYQGNKEYYSLSTVEYMFACLEIDFLTTDTKKEERLYFKYYKSWLMGMARNLYWPNDPHMNNCVLLLTGKEQIRKTSHFRYMLPEFMREDRIAFTTHGFSTENSMRDLIKLASGNSLLVWDEIEQYLTTDTESNFKKLIDSNPTKFIDKYETVEHSYKPIAMFGATSNQKEFNLSDTGSRRLFHIPVRWVDTDSLDKVFWWRIINDLKAEIKAWTGSDPPWLLTNAELEYQAQLHGRITAKSGLELVIREIWDFNCSCFLPEKKTTFGMLGSPLKDSRFLSTKAVIDRIMIHTNGKVQVPRAQLVRIMHNLCGTWTKTKNSARMYTSPRIGVFRGVAQYGSNHRLWVVPLSINPYEK